MQATPAHPAANWEPASLALAFQLRSQINAGMGWFYTIAGLTVLNSLLLRMELSFTFVVGLAASQYVDAISIVVAREFGGTTANVLSGIGLGLSIGMASLFFIAGWLGRRRQRWAVLAGLALYALDALMLIAFTDWLGFLFHGLALWGLWRGAKAIGDLRRLEAARPELMEALTATLPLPGNQASSAPSVLDPIAIPRLHQPVVAATTMRSFLSEPFNWFLVLPTVLLGFASLLAMLVDSNAAFLVLAAGLLGFAGYYSWTVLTRRIEISNDGVRYRERRRCLFFPWQAIERVKIERHLKQLTFWTNGKHYRIHEFGLPSQELQQVREILGQQIAARRLPT